VLGSAIIVFREVLEAALIVAVVMGATRGAAGRGAWVSGGIALGVIGACIVAAFAGRIADFAEGRGQEIFNATVLLAAVAMLAWHNVWMNAHGRRIAEDVRRLGHAITVGEKPLSAMLVVTALAVLREGSETALFLYGLFAGGTTRYALVAGGALGLAGGALLGYLLYLGLVRIPIGRFFSVTGWIVLLLAAGLAASAADFLTQAGLLPVLSPQVWDTTAFLSQDSLPGQILHVLIGYQDRPSGIALVFYSMTLVTVLALMRLAGRGSGRRSAVAAHSGGARSFSSTP
jgi:high-affinity iron transporter